MTDQFCLMVLSTTPIRHHHPDMGNSSFFRQQTMKVRGTTIIIILWEQFFFSTMRNRIACGNTRTHQRRGKKERDYIT